MLVVHTDQNDGWNESQMVFCRLFLAYCSLTVAALGTLRLDPLCNHKQIPKQISESPFYVSFAYLTSGGLLDSRWREVLRRKTRIHSTSSSRRIVSYVVVIIRDLLIHE